MPILYWYTLKILISFTVTLFWLDLPDIRHCRMLSAKLAAWITLTVVLAVVLTPCEGSDTFDRQMRAPFNGMRGKRFPLNLNMYRKVARKWCGKKCCLTFPSYFWRELPSMEWEERETMKILSHIRQMGWVIKYNWWLQL